MTANQYQPLSSPELAHVVLDPQEDSEPSLSKTFVLDNSRLQLEPIKQTFGLITVEIILGAYGDLEGAAYQLPVLIDNLPPPLPPWCFPQLHSYFLTFKTYKEIVFFGEYKFFLFCSKSSRYYFSSARY